MKKSISVKEEVFHKTEDERKKLNEAFLAFTETTAKFQEGYAKLEAKVAYLSRELEEKNKSLSENIKVLDRTRKYLNSILQNISDGVMAVDLSGRITTFNKAAESITSYNEKEVIGQHFGFIFGKDTDCEFVDLIHEITLLDGKEVYIKNKNGEKLTVIAYSMPITDENANVRGLVVTFNDISKIKELENEIERSKRLASLGEMAAGVAHEIRNPLGGIEMFSSLLLRECRNDERKYDIAQNIVQGVKGLNKIVTGLLTFTRTLKDVHFRKIDLTDAIEVALAFSKVEFEEYNVQLVKKYDITKPIYVKGNSDQLKQVFLNIFLNAAQAMNKDNAILEIDCLAVAQDGYVIVAIEDNGCGMSADCLEKIFDPFFTTKDKGTGLGLSISYRIIDAHGGKIKVESKIGKGTKFLIYLPLILN